MKKKIFGIFICMILVITILPVSATSNHTSFISSDNGSGTKWNFKSRIDISAPDENSYRCIMFCDNHEQTLQWKSLISELGFEKAWQKKFMELTLFLFLPGTIFLFGTMDFRNWYAELFIILRNKDVFLDFLNTYDDVNGSGTIIYLWLSEKTNRLVDFKVQPDDSWIEDSWVLDNSGAYIPNPEIWIETFFWYFDMPWV